MSGSEKLADITERVGPDTPTTVVKQAGVGLPVSVPITDVTEASVGVNPVEAAKMYAGIDRYKNMSEAERYFHGMRGASTLGVGPLVDKAALSVADALAGTNMYDQYKSGEQAIADYSPGGVTAENFGSGVGNLASALIPVGRAGKGSLAILEKAAAGQAEKTLSEGIGMTAAKYLQGAGGRVVGMAARGGFEGGVYGGAGATNDLIIHDKPLAGEVIMEGILGGALVGGGIGTFAGAVGEMGHAGINLASNSLLQRAEQGVAERIGVKSGSKEFLAQARSELEAAGMNPSKMGREEILQAAEKNAETYASLRKEAIYALDKDGVKVSASRMADAVENAAGDESVSVHSAIQKSGMKVSGDNVSVRSAHAAVDAISASRAISTETKDAVQSAILTEMASAMEAKSPELAKQYKAASFAEKASRDIADVVREAEPKSGHHYHAKIPALSVVEALTGHPVGAVLSYAARNAAARIADSQAVQEGVLHMSATGRLAQLTNGAAEAIGKSVRAFLSPSKEMARDKFGSPSREEYKKASEEVQRITSPEFRAMVEEHANKVAMDRETHDAIMASYDQSASQLQQRFSASDPAPSLVGGRKGGKALSRNELNAYRTWNIAKNPQKAIAALCAGKLSRDEAKTVRTMYPAMFSVATRELQKQVFQMQQSGKHLDVNKVVGMSLILGQPMDKVMEPKFIRSMQASYAYGQVQREKQRASGGGGGQSITSSPFATPTQKMR